MMEYSVEFRLCGVAGCDLCKKVGMYVRTPYVIVDGVNIRKQALRFMTLTMEDEDDKNYYLAPSEASMKIESENLSLENLKSYLPNTKNNTEEKKYIAERKKEDKSFLDSAIARCNSCGVTRVIYSHKKVGVRDGPTVKDLEKLKNSLEKN